MPAMQIGRECVKTSGRKAGEKMTVVKVIDSNYVEVKDAKGKVKKCNVKHLEPV